MSAHPALQAHITHCTAKSRNEWPLLTGCGCNLAHIIHRSKYLHKFLHLMVNI